jgi:hypothetical protein
MEFARTLTIIAVAGLVLGADWTFAQDAPVDDLEITMTLMPEDGDLPDAVTRELELPVFPESDENEEQQGDDNSANSADGLEIANQAREDGRAFGQDTAAAAQENRENLGRGMPPEDLPLGPPEDPPGPPDNPPGPPDNVPEPPVTPGPP